MVDEGDTHEPDLRYTDAPSGRGAALWGLLGLGFCATGLAVVAAVAADENGALLWKLLASAAVALVSASAVFAGSRLGLPGRLLAAESPVAAALLLVGVWHDEASRFYVQLVLTAAVVLLTGLGAATARLLARGPAAEATFRAVAVLAAAIAVLSLVLTWWGRTPEPLLSALFGLIGATVVLYAATAVIARLER